jgi:universal stress protein A
MTDSITRILVPVDFSPHSDHAVRYAAMLAGRIGAAVQLLHVVEDPMAAGAFSAEIYVPNMPEMVNALISDSGRRLVTIRDSVFPHGTDVETKVVVGRAAHSIVGEAKDGHFDLLVMGTHGRSGFSHRVMGSVAERVVRTAPCAVLTVHRAEGAASSKAA